MAVLANSNDLVAHKDKIRVLAFGASERYEVFPDAPTFIEKGYDMLPSIDRGVAVPPGTPAEIIQVLENAFLKISNDPEIQKQMVEQVLFLKPWACRILRVYQEINKPNTSKF